MGMGNYPCFACVVEQEFVGEIAPAELAALNQAIDDAEYSLDGLGMHNQDLEGGLGMELEEEQVTKIVEAYDELCRVFKARTDLDLEVMYHNKEDRGDEVDGAFWTVDGVWQFSPAGKKYKDKWEQKGWTVYG